MAHPICQTSLIREGSNAGNPRPNRSKEVPQGEDGKFTHHTFNTIAGGFVGGRETNSAETRYALQILSIENLHEFETKGKLQMQKPRLPSQRNMVLAFILRLHDHYRLMQRLGN